MKILLVLVMAIVILMPGCTKNTEWQPVISEGSVCLSAIEKSAEGVAELNSEVLRLQEIEVTAAKIRKSKQNWIDIVTKSMKRRNIKIISTC